jgi:hypothetical protein
MVIEPFFAMVSLCHLGSRHARRGEAFRARRWPRSNDPWLTAAVVMPGHFPQVRMGNESSSTTQPTSVLKGPCVSPAGRLA